MAKADPEREAHESWLGLVQPIGLVVSLLRADPGPEALDKNVILGPASASGGPGPTGLSIRRRRPGDSRTLPPRCSGGRWETSRGDRMVRPWPRALAVALPNHGEKLRPSYAVVAGMAAAKVLLLVQGMDRGLSLDKPQSEDARIGWRPAKRPPGAASARHRRLGRSAAQRQRTGAGLAGSICGANGPQRIAKRRAGWAGSGPCL